MTCFVTIEHDERVLGWAKSADWRYEVHRSQYHLWQLMLFIWPQITFFSSCSLKIMRFLLRVMLCWSGSSFTVTSEPHVRDSGISGERYRTTDPP